MKKHMFIFLLFIAKFSHSYEVREVCASYKKDFQWIRSESASIAIYSGQEIQNNIGYNRYIMPYNYYAFVTWDNGYISVVELRYYFSGMLLFNLEGFDETGRHWRFSDNSTGFCI